MKSPGDPEITVQVRYSAAARLDGRAPAHHPDEGEHEQRPDEGDGQGAHESLAAVDEYPRDQPADERPEQAYDEVADQAEAVSSTDLAGGPAGDQADQDPGDDSARRQFHRVTPA